MIYVIGPKDECPEHARFIDVTSRARSPFSPFLNDTLKPIKAKVMENAWQYSKVYPEHLESDGSVGEKWLKWRQEGLDNPNPIRYPMGRGAKPLYSYFNGEELGYVEARKKLYIQLYKNMLRNRISEILELVKICRNEDVALWDFDGYRTSDSFETILNNPKKKMGHAFVLKRILLDVVEVVPGE